MLSRTGTYALQAALHLARTNGDGNVTATAMADRLGIPPTYLAKVLHRLAREGVMVSTRGAGGGYRLTARPTELSVAAVVAPFQELQPRRDCLLGGPCDLRNPCSAHRRREQWTAEVLAVLERTTLADLLADAPAGAGLDDLPNTETSR